ncbi:NAD(P)-binding protein [Erwinia rhapontici]|uniref:oxidoreductase n=1 Tax=Erwinia rhapontici TaxID=55212 RepID=UPI00143858AA|nr:NAD(P)-binding protein [Erwinia rhapontici]
MTDVLTAEADTLFSPLKVGRRTLRNRIINSGHGTSLGPGTHNEDLLAYEARRAEGGAAVVITQANAVSPGAGDFYALYEAESGKYDELARRIQAQGALSFVQLNHPGKQAFLGPNRGDEILWSASAVPHREYGKQVRVPTPLSDSEILQIIEDFARAAEAVAQTAVDGIELHFGHGNLVQQFMSPETNHREDRWGGSAENRNRLAWSILVAVRQRVGDRLVVGARVNLELSPQEETQTELTEQVQALMDSGLLDYVSVSGGNFSSGWGVSTNLPDASFPPALWREAARKLSQHPRQIPIFLAGRVLTAGLAEQLIRDGYCDAVTMARELVADPDLPLKAQRGEADSVRPCVGIQSGCWQRVADGKPIHCAFNPVAGREVDERDNAAVMVDTALNVSVIGAGPAGLEAARHAALLGHRVTLYDRQSQPGGLLALIEKVPHRQDLRNIIGWFERELAVSGVELRLGADVNATSLLASAPDQVIVACGAQEVSDAGWLDAFNGQILTVSQALTQPLDGLQPVLVYDEWGGRAALSVAEYLAAQGHQIEFVTPLTYPGEGLNGTVRLPAVARLARLGCRFSVNQSLHLRQGALIRVDSLSGEQQPLSERFTALVTSRVPTVNFPLFTALQQAGIAVQIIGDARAPRGITEATREGYLAARTFGRVRRSD